MRISPVDHQVTGLQRLILKITKKTNYQKQKMQAWRAKEVSLYTTLCRGLQSSDKRDRHATNLAEQHRYHQLTASVCLALADHQCPTVVEHQQQVHQPAPHHLRTSLTIASCL